MFPQRTSEPSGFGPAPDDPDAGTNPDQAEQGFGITLLHPYAAVGDRVPHGRGIRSAVDAHARDRETIQRVPSGFSGPGGIGSRSSPSWSRADTTKDGGICSRSKPTMGCGRPGASGCNREDAERSSALVEVKPVRVTPNDDEAACRSSVACLCRRRPSRPVRSLAVEGREGRRAHNAVDLESDGAEATDRCDAQGSVAPSRGPARPVRAQEDWVSATSQPLTPNVRVRVPRRWARTAEGRAGERPGTPSTVSR